MGGSTPHAAASDRLIHRAGVADSLDLGVASEEAWIEVIHRMDAVYADLVRNQLELEGKNNELESAQRFIDSVLASMTDVLIVCDLAGRIVRANASAEAVIGVAAAASNAFIQSVFMKDSEEVAAAMLPKVLAGSAVVDVEASLEGRDGAAVPISMNCTPQHDHNGKLVGFVLIGRSVGDLRRAFEALDNAHKKLTRTQQQLVSAEKMAALGQLVAGVAHELNNPISFVFGNLHALKRYGVKLETFLNQLMACMSLEDLRKLQGAKDLSRIADDLGPLIDGTLEGAQRVSEIVQDLRRFSSSQKEGSESYNLLKVVQTAADWVTKSARIKPALSIHAEGPMEVKGFQRSVHQIIVNFVQNSVDVLSKVQRGEISITCVVADGMATVKVRDNGPGIRPEHVSRVFEPFFTTKAVGEGTGLGLYVSYNLAQELGGRIEVENAPDGGASFSLHFPSEGRADG
ncbi:MAG: PAS domain-containing protein [Rhizobiales bacterium]|nr:PAS domain-containing protein [Hyphomicrobiales bacterium]